MRSWLLSLFFFVAGIVTYTDAEGRASEETVTRDGNWCPMPARWVALVVSERIPDKPPPPPCPMCAEHPPCSDPRPCPACPPAE